MPRWPSTRSMPRRAGRAPCPDPGYARRGRTISGLSRACFAAELAALDRWFDARRGASRLSRGGRAAAVLARLPGGGQPRTAAALRRAVREADGAWQRGQSAHGQRAAHGGRSGSASCRRISATIRCGTPSSRAGSSSWTRSASSSSPFHLGAAEEDARRAMPGHGRALRAGRGRPGAVGRGASRSAARRADLSGDRHGPDDREARQPAPGAAAGGFLGPSGDHGPADDRLLPFGAGSRAAARKRTTRNGWWRCRAWAAPCSRVPSPAAVDLAAGHRGDAPLLLCPGTPFKYTPGHDRRAARSRGGLGDASCVLHHWARALSGKAAAAPRARVRARGLDLGRYVRFVPWQSRPRSTA